VPLKHRERGFFERRQRARARIVRRRAVFNGGRMEIFEIRDQLVDRRLRQLDARFRNVSSHFCAWIE